MKQYAFTIDIYSAKTENPDVFRTEDHVWIDDCYGEHEARRRLLDVCLAKELYVRRILKSELVSNDTR